MDTAPPSAGHLDWQAPAGRGGSWLFLCVGAGEPICDYLDPEAVDRFISITHQAYFDRFARHFRTTINSTFFDEPTLYRAEGRTGRPLVMSKPMGPWATCRGTRSTPWRWSNTPRIINLLIRTPSGMTTESPSSPVVVAPSRYGARLRVQHLAGPANVMLQNGGTHVADIAVLYPIATLQGSLTLDPWATTREGRRARGGLRRGGQTAVDQVGRDYTYLHPDVGGRMPHSEGHLELPNRITVAKV
jgi:hypothetical protein